MSRLLVLHLLWFTGCHSAGQRPGSTPAPPDDSAIAGDSGGPPAAPCAALTAEAMTDHTDGRLPFQPHLDASRSCGPATIVDWSWEIDGQHLSGPAVSPTLLRAGPVEAVLTVTDAEGAQARDTLALEVHPDACPAGLDGQRLGALADPALVEASGLVVSRRDPAVLWSHNDSGDHARLFALGRDGAALGTWSLGLPDSDWEDLAWGVDPATGAPLLFIGDTGNNDLSREALSVYIIEEPVVDRAAAPADHAVTAWATLTLRLPEPLNVDTIFVDPVSGDLFLLSDAADGRAVLLRKPAPHADGDDVLLEVAAELLFGADPLPGDTLALAGDISPFGERVALRTRDEAWLYLRDGGQSVAEALAGTPCPIPLPEQELGETLAFDPRDGGLLTVGEGAGETLWWVPFEEQPACYNELVAAIHADPPGGPLPVTITFDLAEACLPLGSATAAWTIDGLDETLLGDAVSATFLASGSIHVRLDLSDASGATASAHASIPIEAGDCPTTASAEVLGTVADTALTELSGVVPGQANPDLLWVHNDSGHDPQLFALDRAGATVAVYDLAVERSDIEDIAASMSPGGSPELWVGSIGDNLREREFIEVYRLDEPVVTGTGGLLDTFDTLTLRYPDGPHNAETLMVDPVTRDLYIVTKEADGHSGVFRKQAPHADGDDATLERVADLDFGGASLPGGLTTTAGDFSPDGAWIVIRTYNATAWLWRRDRSSTVEAAFATAGCPLSMPAERQAEAIAFDRDGQHLISISEGAGQPINRVALARGAP